jgi:hypothetical protein
MSEKNYNMVYDQFLYEMTMNLAGNDGNNPSFESRLKNRELTSDQQFSLVNTMCLLTNARPSGDVSHNAVKKMFVAFKYIKNEDLQNMMLKEINNAATSNSSGNPEPTAVAAWILDYMQDKDNNDERISKELLATTNILIESRKGHEYENNVKEYGLKIIQQYSSNEITKMRGEEPLVAPAKQFISLPQHSIA